MPRTLLGARVISDASPPILIATDRAPDAQAIARLLGEEFAKVHVTTDQKRWLPDFELIKPAVLVLAFNTLAKSERCLQALQQPAAMAKMPPHRVLILCGAEDLREAYELCKTDHFDDFVLFWPRTDETRPLRMAVRRALRQVIALRSGAPGVADFAALARQLGAFELLLEERAQAAGGGAADSGLAPLLDAVRALHALARRCPPLILVVDDDRFQHKLLGQLLATEKVEMDFAASVADAVVSLHQHRPDLILMDVNLPDGGGVEATRLLKSASWFAPIPVIMITGVGGRDVVVDSLKAGAADFVVKPVDKDILLGKVRKLLYGRAALN